MTISEALKASRDTGITFSRSSSSGYVGWIAYHPTHVYKHLTADDLMADDWETSAAKIERITGGKWRLVEEGHLAMGKGIG